MLWCYDISYDSDDAVDSDSDDYYDGVNHGDSMHSYMLSIIVLQGNNTYGLRDSIAHDDFHSSPRRTTKTLYNAL